ncbi:MAG: hypothetical protein ACRENP_25435 [Longimicrobiales bacterium]
MHTQSKVARRDVYVQNDSSGFSIVAVSALDRIIEDDRNDDRAIVMDHEAVLLALHGDDSFPARLVLGGPLTTDEESEWIARVTWKLAIPGGRLLLCGGFDPRSLSAWRDCGDDWDGTVQPFDVPPGEYRIDVYTYRPTINGRFLEESWPQPLGAWFRQTHPGRPYPAWLVEELRVSPELDPGHEKEWEYASDEDIRARVTVDDAQEYVIGYLVHLQPWDAAATLSPLPADGWFQHEEGARIPARFPLGLATEARPREDNCDDDWDGDDLDLDDDDD